ncbi:MAG: BON domain-containing protein [Planctomycetota bacterium]|nr:BON domain-containing protein [Planctomycetota bacterium]
MPELTVEDCCRQAQVALVSSPVYELRDLSVARREDALLLRGRVSSFYHKQLAQEAVRAAAPDVQLVNSINVD